jgi:hypothetical protein
MFGIVVRRFVDENVDEDRQRLTLELNLKTHSDRRWLRRWHSGLTLDYVRQDSLPQSMERNPRIVEPGNAAASELADPSPQGRRGLLGGAAGSISG